MSKKSRLKHRLQKVILRKTSQLDSSPTPSPNQATLWALTAATLGILTFIGFSLLKSGVPSGHDIALHLTYSKLFLEALSQGQFPVRWIEWIKNGSSFPLFNFYQVGFYYLVAVIHPFLGSISTSVKVTALMLWWAGALFAFLYSRRFGLVPAFTAAVIYALTPYLILDVFVRASYPELTAIVFATALLWGIDRLVTTGKAVYSVAVSIFLVGLLISHLPTALIFTPPLLGYFLLLAISNQTSKKSTVQLIAAGLLGLGISSFYLLPAALEINYVKSSLLTSAYYDFHQHFVYPSQLFSTFWGYGISKPGPDDGMSFQLGTVQWFLIFSALTVILGKRYLPKTLQQISIRAESQSLYLTFWLLVLLYALFFMQEISLNFWENISFIDFIQYPWRFLMVVPIASSIIGAILVSLLNRAQQVVSFAILTTAIFLLYHSYLAPAVYLPDSYFDIDSPNWKTSQGVLQNVHIESGYLPKDVESIPDQNLGQWTLVKGSGQITPIKLYYHHIILTSQSDQSLTLQINSHYFPGWKAYIDHALTPLDHSNPQDYMTISLPPGLHQLEVKFEDTTLRVVANDLSLLSLLVLVGWQLRPFIRKVR